VVLKRATCRMDSFNKTLLWELHYYVFNVGRLDIMQGTVSAILTANLTDIKQEPKLTYIVNHGL
jgi:hypothetical protein